MRRSERILRNHAQAHAALLKVHFSMGVPLNVLRIFNLRLGANLLSPISWK